MGRFTVGLTVYHINGDQRLISYLGAVKVTLGYLTPTLLYKLGHGAPITRCIIMYYCICIVSIYWELELHPQVLFMYPLVVCCTALEAMAQS